MVFGTLEPYCGPPPIPSDVWTRWTFDPVAILLIAGLALAWLHAGRRDRVGRMAISAALALIALAFLSPLCALTTALFSARVAHHMVLVAVIAPLLATALPWRGGPLLPLAPVTLLAGLTLWLWHAPSTYQWAIYGAFPYWLMQASLLGTAYLFWREILSPLSRTAPAIVALIAFVAQMGLLGALLVFSPFAIYAPHLATTGAFGLSALSDQQLAGLVMWVPAALPYIGVGVHLLNRLVGRGPETRAGWTR
ncbi:cytochrome c oxidase assembly protein [Pelagibacterium lacus]|uniref:Cytochrome c oxidase assembly protein n=1 Tax=Pelagibacterium lacus TaxID=2282655 RepID=A0A369W4U2_9HYPH|nr:cytochrome c oxidase assembly protein [Pelagibacterium lacus]RDE09716.1 cytochrome c oxidase assembly protein [Pelagibacterium lacus]